MLEFVIGYSAGQRTSTRAASLARSAAVAETAHHTNRVEDLNERIDRLAMIVRAMWELLEEQGMTPEQLVEKLEAMDLVDGEADGQMRQAPIDCPACDSKVAPGLAKCQFCGVAIPRDDDHPLDQVT